jgi:hypothetical protein
MPLLEINRDAAAELLLNPEIFGLTVAVILEATFEPAVLYGQDTGEPLDALTIFHELERKYRVQLNEAAQNKVQAVMTLHTTEAYENDPLAFTGITLALTEGYLGDLVTGTLEELDGPAVMWSLFEAAAIDPYLRQLGPDVQQLAYDALMLPEDSEDADGVEDIADPMTEFTEQLQLLQKQLRTLEMSQKLANQLIQRGLAALPDVDEQNQGPDYQAPDQF